MDLTHHENYHGVWIPGESWRFQKEGSGRVSHIKGECDQLSSTRVSMINCHRPLYLTVKKVLKGTVMQII